MDQRKNSFLAAIALLVGAIIGVVLGFLYEPTFDREKHPRQSERDNVQQE